MKAALFDVKVKSELELLSVLSTSDLKAVGGEILLTWGGEALTGIIHPQVHHEVLMTVGHSPPFYFFTSGVGVDEFNKMANNLLDQMVTEHGQVSLTHLGHLHNLVPYADSRILDASSSDVKLFVSSVLLQICKSVCLSREARMQMRNFLLKGYGSPDTWSALDLVQMGDLLVVMNPEDLRGVQPTSLRLASTQLTENSRYTQFLEEIWGESDKVLYHEACSAWLGGADGADSEEGRSFYLSWRNLAQFYVLGSHLQVELVLHNLRRDTPRAMISDEDWLEKLYRRKLDPADYQSCVEANHFSDQECFRGLTLHNCISDGNPSALCRVNLIDELKSMSNLDCQSSPSFTKEECFLAFTILFRDNEPDQRDGVEPVIDLNRLYQRIMTDMKSRFDAELLSDLQKTEATLAISETQALLANHSFAVLGLDKGDLSQDQILGVLAAYRNSGNMTERQNLAIQELATDTQVRMVQELIDILDLTPQNLDLENHQFEDLVNKKTFDVYGDGLPNVEINPGSPHEVVTPSELLTSTVSSTTNVEGTTSTEAVIENNTPLATTSSPLVNPHSSLTPETTIPVTVPTTEPQGQVSTNVPNTTPEATTTVTTPVTTFSKYEPDFSMFNTLPSMEQLVLTCDCLKASGSAASALTSSIISGMSRSQVLQCFDTLGKLPWPRDAVGSVWTAIRDKVDLVEDGVGGEAQPIKRKELLLLETLNPAIAAANPDLIDFDRQNIDGISVLGRLLKADFEDLSVLMQKYMTTNSISLSNPFLNFEAASLGQLLCGLTENQWITFITSDVFSAILSSTLAHLDCAVDSSTKDHLSNLLLDKYGPTSSWTTSDLLSAGWLASCLEDSSLSSLPPHSMEGLTPSALKYLDNRQLHLLSPAQISNISPHAMSLVTLEQLMPYTEYHRRMAVRKVGGEGARVRRDLESIEEGMAEQETTTQGATPTPEPEPETTPTPEPEPTAEVTTLTPETTTASANGVFGHILILVTSVLFLGNL
jgi:hypothetical protein